MNTEDEALEEILGETRGSLWLRIGGRLFSIFTFVVMILLMLVMFRQSAQTDQDAFEAFKREANVQNVMNSTRLVQSISAEEFLSFGSSNRRGGPCQALLTPTPSSPPSGACVQWVNKKIDALIHGRFVGISALRILSRVRPTTGFSEPLPSLSRILRDLNSLERWVVPLAPSIDTFLEDELYTRLLARVELASRTHPDSRWRIVRARLDALAVKVGGTSRARCDLCARLIWGKNTGVEPPSSMRRVDPNDSFEVYSWQAECLRKLPVLIEPKYAQLCPLPSKEHALWDLAKAAQVKGERVARKRFKKAAEWLKSTSDLLVEDQGLKPRVGATVPDTLECGVLNLGEHGVGLRTLATTAARVFNGRAMTLMNNSAIKAGALVDAEEAIKKAICFRKSAKQTSAEVALSQENLAVIAYRRAYLKAKADKTDAEDIKKAFDEARCLAEIAVADNVNLPWSWTVIYITGASYQSLWGNDSEQTDCKELVDDSSLGLIRVRPNREVWRRLIFMEPGAFAPDELPGLLPLLSTEWNSTGYDDLRGVLSDIEREHNALQNRENGVLAHIWRLLKPFREMWSAVL